MPAAIAAQNRRCSSRPAADGRPGDDNRARPHRSERLCLLIATSFIRVLRRPFESAQYTSIAFGTRCREAGVRPSMGSVGDAYDNAMAESFFATLECELIDRHRFKTQAEARIAVFTFIEGFYNPRRRHSSIGYLSPTDYERSLLDPAARDPAIVLAPVEARPGSGEIGCTTGVIAGRDEKMISAEQKDQLKGGAMPSNLTP